MSSNKVCFRRFRYSSPRVQILSAQGTTLWEVVLMIRFSLCIRIHEGRPLSLETFMWVIMNIVPVSSLGETFEFRV